MPGLKTILPLLFSDTSIPALLEDPVLTGVGGGSLVLAETTDMTALPALGGLATVPNIAASRALPLLAGGTTLTDTYPTIFASSVQEPTVAKIERTGRGAFHQILSQSVGVSGRGSQFSLPLSVRNYIAANPSHAYGFWFWMNLTRPGKGPSSGSGQNQPIVIEKTSGTTTPPMIGNQGAVLAMAYGVSMQWFNPGGASDYYSLSRASTGAAGQQRVSAAVKGGWSLAANNTVASDGTNLTAVVNIGTLGGGANNDSTLVNSAPSIILYRAYVEDLTVSGRTAAAVDALDLAAYTAAFATNGRFNGDTFTAVSTLP